MQIALSKQNVWSASCVCAKISFLIPTWDQAAIGIRAAGNAAQQTQWLNVYDLEALMSNHGF